MGFVHADPHPGNLLVRAIDRHGRILPPPDRANDVGPPAWLHSLAARLRAALRGCQAQLVLLDHGLYMDVRRDVRASFCQLWKAIVIKDTAALRQSAAALGVSNAEMLASVILQRPYATGTVGFSTLMTQTDYEQMRRWAAQHMDQMVTILQQMPRSLMLVLRNINLVRSINKDLGAPINRFTIMANWALRGIHSDQRSSWPTVLLERVLYNLRLHITTIGLQLTSMYIAVLAWIGLLSPELGAFIGGDGARP